jgi:cytochrome c2
MALAVIEIEVLGRFPGEIGTASIFKATSDSRCSQRCNEKYAITRDERAFKASIADPKAKVPGTRITFGGIKESEVSNVWGYLKQFDAREIKSFAADAARSTTVPP